MPLTIVRYDANRLNNFGYAHINNPGMTLRPLGEILAKVVAEALHTQDNPEGYLKAEDIAISFQPTAEFDVNVIDFSILIFANDYHERRCNLDERKEIILRRLKEFMPEDTTFSIWILLAPGAYGSYSPS